MLNWLRWWTTPARIIRCLTNYWSVTCISSAVHLAQADIFQVIFYNLMFWIDQNILKLDLELPPIEPRLFRLMCAWKIRWRIKKKYHAGWYIQLTSLKILRVQIPWKRDRSTYILASKGNMLGGFRRKGCKQIEIDGGGQLFYLIRVTKKEKKGGESINQWKTWDKTKWVQSTMRVVLI